MTRGLTMPAWMRSPRVQIGAILAIQVLLALASARGYDRGDGYCYSTLAAELAGRDDVYTEPCAPYFRVRFGYLLPMAGSFMLFGFREWAALLPQFLFALVGSVAMFSLARRLIGQHVAALAMLIYATLPYTIRGGGVLYADFSMFHWTTVGLALFFPDVGASNRRKIWSLGASAVAFACAWLTKSSVTCLAPILAVILVWRLVKARSIYLGSTVAFLCTSGVCLGLELLFYQWTRGNALHRLSALEETISDFEHLWEGMVSFQRFAVDGPMAILSYGSLGPTPWIALPLVAFALLRGGRRARLFSLWFVYLFAFFNFMTTSFDEYKPIRPVPLYFICIVQPALLLLLDAVDRLWRWRGLEEWKWIGPWRTRSGQVTALLRVGLVTFLAGVVLFSLAIIVRHDKVNMVYLREAVQWLDSTDRPEQPPVRVVDRFRVWDLEFLGAHDPPSLWDESDDRGLLGSEPVDGAQPGEQGEHGEPHAPSEARQRIVMSFGDPEPWRLELEDRIGRRVETRVLVETPKYTVIEVTLREHPEIDPD